MNGEQRESNLERRVREGMRKKKGKVKWKKHSLALLTLKVRMGLNFDSLLLNVVLIIYLIV